jgi:hypothetical protein
MLKTGPHHMLGGDQVTRAWMTHKPSVVKFCFGDFGLSALADPATLTIGRPDGDFFKDFPIMSGDAIAMATQMVSSRYAPIIQAFPKMKAWEGPNEVIIKENEIAKMDWYSTFLAEFARQIHALGKTAVVGGWATGNPEFSLWEHYRATLQACHDYGAILSRHCYGPLHEWLSLRYRQDQRYFNDLGFNPKLAITECGADKTGDGQLPNNYPGPWRSIWDDEADYVADWVIPFEDEIQKDDYVIGATIFTVGNGFSSAWDKYNVGLTTLDMLVAHHKEAPVVPDNTPQPLFQCLANPLKANVLGYHTAPDLPAYTHPPVSWTMDVWEVGFTQTGVWFRVSDAIWVMADECIPLPQPISP